EAAAKVCRLGSHAKAQLCLLFPVNLDGAAMVGPFEYHRRSLRGDSFPRIPAALSSPVSVAAESLAGPDTIRHHLRGAASLPGSEGRRRHLRCGSAPWIAIPTQWEPSISDPSAYCHGSAAAGDLAAARAVTPSVVSILNSPTRLTCPSRAWHVYLLF